MGERRENEKEQAILHQKHHILNFAGRNGIPGRESLVLGQQHSDH